MNKIKNYLYLLGKIQISLVIVFMLAFPASTSYEMKTYEFGGGGGKNIDSTNYSLEGITSEVSGANPSSTTYRALPGLNYVQQADVPAAPTFTNNSGTDYSKLKFIIDNGTNPTDATFAIAISTDSFATTNYIQADDTIGSNPVFQTYANWGGASGEFVIGLAPSTTYTIKVKARQGKYTESPFSQTASAATTNVTLTFDIDTASTDTESAPPYSVSLGDLTPGSVITGTNKIWIDLTTNADNGGFVYVSDANGGLKSTILNNTITSASADLSVASSGYGLQGASKTQSSGGPLRYVAPYDGTSQSVGLVSTTIRKVFDTTDAPISAGRGSLNVKAKAASTTPAATDYGDTLTLIAAGSF